MPKGFTVKTTYTPQQIAKRKAEAKKIASQRKRAKAADAQRAKDIAYNKRVDRFNAAMKAWNKNRKGKKPRWGDFKAGAAPKKAAKPATKGKAIDMSSLGALPSREKAKRTAEDIVRAKQADRFRQERARKRKERARSQNAP